VKSFQGENLFSFFGTILVNNNKTMDMTKS
jgi:hypothetical protein